MWYRGVVKPALAIASVALLFGVAIFLLRPGPDGPSSRTPPKPDPVKAPEKKQPEERKPDVKPGVEAKKPGIRELLNRLAMAIRGGDKKQMMALLEELKALVIPPEIPDEENAALVYEEAFKAMSDIGDNPEAAAAYDRALKGEITAGDARSLRDWIQKNKKAIDLLREAAMRPGCRFALKWEDGFSMQLPHISKMMMAGNLLRIDGMIRQLEGNGATAADSFHASLAMGMHIRQEPILISQLVGSAMDGISADGLGGTSLNSGSLESFIGRLDPEAIRRTYAQSLVGEVYFAVQTFMRGDMASLLEGRWDWLKDPLRPHDVAYYVETMTEIISLSDLPYHEMREKMEILEKTRMENSPYYAEATRELLPGISSVARNIAKSEARLNMAKIALDLDRYRAKHGHFPTTLHSLSGTVPSDPLTGQAFRYRLEGSGFVLETTATGDQVQDLSWKRK